MRGLGELCGVTLGEQGGVPEEESDPRPSVNQENGTKDPEERDGLSDGSLRTEDEVRTQQTYQRLFMLNVELFEWRF